MSAVKSGGIPLQIVDGVNGYLVDTVEQAAERVCHLFKNQEEAKQMGISGREHVRENFLVLAELRDYLLLCTDLLGIKKE